PEYADVYGESVQGHGSWETHGSNHNAREQVCQRVD
ncbi:unnamed protein product, partial [marine sediment metagenome]